MIGGFGSIGGTALAALVVGLVQQLANYYLYSGIGDVSVVLLLAAVLLVRPGGLTGTDGMTDLAQALTDRAVSATGCSGRRGRPPAGRILAVLVPLAVLAGADLPALDGVLDTGCAARCGQLARLDAAAGALPGRPAASR